MPEPNDSHNNDALWEEVLEPIEDDGTIAATSPLWASTEGAQAPATESGDAGAPATERARSAKRRRPRAHANPAVVTGLGAIILAAAGFTGGVVVQKHRGGDGTATAAAGGPGGGQMPSGFAGGPPGANAMGNASSSSAGTTPGSSGQSGAPGSQAGGGQANASSASGSSLTTGEVANVRGGTIYVTKSDGTVVRVVAASGATVARTSKSAMTAVHPGDTVVISGAKDDDGTVKATSVRATSSDANN
jgi:hypothetical protein